MLKLWHNRSGARNFSAILATSKIEEAIKYFEIINQNPLKPADFKFTLLYDPTLDREANEYEKLETRRDNIEAVIAQYNKDFNTNWKFETHADFKKDLASRLARKYNYVKLNSNEYKNERLDLLIVVNQMLTGFDSKYINTIYFDKTLQYQNLIQAISRTNRILDESTKPFGKVVYYRMPNTMKFNTREAFKIYAEANLNEVQVKDINDFYNKLNEAFKVIKGIFVQWGYANFEDILDVDPSDSDDFILYKGQVKKIVLNHYKIHKYINCIKLKGFTWENNADKLQFTRDDISKINARLRDINREKIRETDISTNEYDNIEIDEDYNAFTDIVDTAQENIDYKYLQKLIINENVNAAEIENEFAKMPKWKAQIARNVLNNIKLQFNGIVPNTIDFQAELQKEIEREENSKIEEICNAFKLNYDKLKEIINSNDELNSYGRLDELLDNSLNEATKQYIANIKDINPKKVKKHHIRSHIEEFIYSMRDKRNRQ
ncbi:type I restriction endonuclease subunit R [Mycoplasmopsis mucosicanis]|uniref:Type I restriction endonuclease subunit R n=1 Tax=Mycoplasmopsis mucosicanis TaxID=458208 RepID=A0A507SPT5_9BACT|nr:type I restriction endonuclease subunit R [Mycoplasmopsis mucosicanis]TQC51368.1 type I restriction endonuclease subunit R [Mycoplasmopsis mucosicanis]